MIIESESAAPLERRPPYNLARRNLGNYSPGETRKERPQQRPSNHQRSNMASSILTTATGVHTSSITGAISGATSKGYAGTSPSTRTDWAVTTIFTPAANCAGVTDLWVQSQTCHDPFGAGSQCSVMRLGPPHPEVAACVPMHLMSVVYNDCPMGYSLACTFSSKYSDRDVTVSNKYCCPT
jgi:hypothetical protein